MDLQLIRMDAAFVRRFLVGTALAIALSFAAGPASAFAAGSVTVDSAGTLFYAGGGNEDNVVTITSDGTNYIVTDQATITAGTGCFAGADIYQATCPVAGTTQISAAPAAGNDTVALDSTVAVDAEVFGGPGNDNLTGGAGADLLGGAGGDDVINSVDGVVDQVFCGAGTDRFTVDPIDQLPPDPSTCEDDGVPPETTITSAPPDLSGSGTATFEFTSSEPGSTFKCGIDGGAQEDCSSPRTYDLSDGEHTFAVYAIDQYGNPDQSQATRAWKIDRGAPNFNLDGPSGTISSNSATFSFSSPDSDLKRFDCRIDGSDWVPCESPITLSFLPEGPHTFGVRAVDTAGNVGTLTLSFTVALPQGSGITSRPASSLVLIAGRTVKLTKRGYAYVALNCSGTRECAGKVLLDTSKKIRAGRRKRVVRLGRAQFQIGAGRTRRVRIHISRKKMRLLRKLRKVSTNITVRDLDGAGRARVSSRTIVLKAPRR